MAEIFTAETWLYSTLHGDGTLLALCPGGVLTWPLPTNAAGQAIYPGQYVLYQMQSGLDIGLYGPGRAGVNGLWLVRVVAETFSFGGNLQTAANRMDVLLQLGVRTAVTGGYIFGCARLEPFQLVEPVGSRQYRHLGGIYRIFVT